MVKQSITNHASCKRNIDRPSNTFHSRHAVSEESHSKHPPPKWSGLAIIMANKIPHTRAKRKLMESPPSLLVSTIYMNSMRRNLKNSGAALNNYEVAVRCQLGYLQEKDNKSQQISQEGHELNCFTIYAMLVSVHRLNQWRTVLLTF